MRETFDCVLKVDSNDKIRVSIALNFMELSGAVWLYGAVPFAIKSYTIFFLAFTKYRQFMLTVTHANLRD